MMRGLAFGVGAALLLAATACGGKQETAAAAEAGEAPTVTLGANDIATAITVRLVAGVPISGPLTPKVSVTVGAPLAEQLVEMLVNEGDVVRQGQPIARFRDDVLRSASLSAQAEVATARTQLRVAEAESTRANALFAEGAISQRDRDNAYLGMESARSRQALVTSQAAGAADRLETATVKAPVSGVVSARHAQAGDRVDFGKPVLDIVNTSVLQLEASVEARWLAELRVGRPVKLTVTGLDGEITGRIGRINPVADPATRQVRVYVEVPNSNGRLVGGLYVSGYAVTREVPNAVAVPKAAIRTEGTEGKPVVYVVTGGRIARREVQPGIEDAGGQLVEVTGVSAGDSVVVGPVDGLTEGMRVEAGASARAPGSR